MKKIKLSIPDNYGNIDFDGSPLWKNSNRYNWPEVEIRLGLKTNLVTRLKDWQRNSIKANESIWLEEGVVQCEIEGLSLLLELRKELSDFEITYDSISSGSYFVLNKEQVDDY